MTSPNYTKAWLFFFLIATIGGAIAGGICGGILGAILAVAGVGIGVIKIAGAVTGFLIGMPISYFTFRWVVGEYIVKPLILSTDKIGTGGLEPTPPPIVSPGP